MYGRSQAGFPNYGNEKTFSRFYLNRGEHSLNVYYIVKRIFDALKNNTPQEDLLKFLEDKGLALKVAALLHDIGHGPFSHVLDKLPGHDNDHETIKLIRDENSNIHKAIIKACGENGYDGKKIIADVLDILGRWSPLYQLISGWGADRIEYIRFSDFPLVNNGRILFPKWSIKDLDNYANTFRLYRDENGKIRIGFTPEGALIAFLMCSDREVFDVLINRTPGSLLVDLLAALALTDQSPNDIRNLSEKQLAKFIFEKVENLTVTQNIVNSKQYNGARIGYSYYSSVIDDPTCISVVNGRVSEFVKYIGDRGVRNYLNELSQSSELFRKYPVSEQELKSRLKAATTLHEIYTQIQIKVPD